MSLRNVVVFLSFAASGAAMLAQTVAAPDPRISHVISELGKVRAPQQTSLSPNGKWIAWTISNKIEVAPMQHPELSRHITACQNEDHGEESDIAWSPDSQHLAFFSNCNASHQQALYLVDAAAQAPARQLAAIHGYADSPQWSPDGKFIGLLYVEGATRPAGALAAMKPPAGVIGVEGLEVQRVAVVNVIGKQLQQVTPANLHVYEFDWSPDSAQLAYVAAPPPGENNWWVAKLYTEKLHGSSVEHQPETFLEGAAPQVLVDPDQVQSPVHGQQIAVPRWSPDGSQIAFISGLMSDQGVTGGDLYTVPSSGGLPKDLTKNSGTTVSWLQWAESGKSHYKFILSVISGGDSLVAGFTPRQGAAEIVPIARFPAHIGDGRLSMSLSLASNGSGALIRSSFAHPPEVWAGPLQDLKQITHYNDQLVPEWGKAESVSWKNEGFNVQGWLLFPANYDPNKKYPLIVMVHGGPSSAVVPRWPGVSFGSAPFSALGYFVLMPNPRGSFGQGEAFTQANRKDFGHGDLRDILAGVDTVTKQYPIDPQRIGITGWSYGGFMTMFSVTQTNRFHAAVAGAGISNWQSYYGENSIDQWMIPFFGASVYDDPAVYAKSSAINFIKNVKTPTLIVVGDRDGECPMPQSFEFWHALRDQHVPTQLVIYPDEGHGFVHPDHRRDVLERALRWFEEYMPAQ